MRLSNPPPLWGLVVARLLFLGLGNNSVSAQICPPPYTTSPDSVSPGDYIAARQECTAACNSAGYCCNVGMGGWNVLPCNVGCHIAFFSITEQECFDECAAANALPCDYTHARHIDTAHLGFNPYWTDWTDRQHGVSKCRSPEQCGCPDNNAPNPFGGDQFNTACAAGCSYAFEATRRDKFYHGLDVFIDLRKDLDPNALLNGLNGLRAMVDEPNPDRTQIDTYKQQISDNQDLLDSNSTIMQATLDLIDDFEASSHGPLFFNGGFNRESSTDNKQLERAMLVVQQAALDVIFDGSLYEFTTEDNPYESVIGPCESFLKGRKWQTSQYFPGHVDPPSDDTVTYTVSIKATMPQCWGKPVAYCKKPSIRATGFYLAPGGIAALTFPPSMVDQGFRIQVGANKIDNKIKSFQLRMDRITSTYDIKSITTYIGSPLGGAVYIWVPYLANLGVVSFTITGDIVEAPIFSKTSHKQTTETEWNRIRTSPAPWADFETDMFLLQVPSIWMYKMTHAYINNLLTDWDKGMDGASEFSGYPPHLRNNYVMYVNPDLHIRHHSYGIGFPQVNNIVSANQFGILPIGPEGNSTQWLLNDPVGWDTEYHELGHQQQASIYEGETEALVNLLLTYAQNVKFGYNFDEAFKNSFPRTGLYTPDAAAQHWMASVNFREGNGDGVIPGEMNHTHPYHQFQYQHRGFAKYADIARLFGGVDPWSVIADFFYQENLNYIADPSYENKSPVGCPGVSGEDARTFRLSSVAGVDLTPLIHFWGIHPVDATALKACMETHGLSSSDIVKNQIERYATIIPMDNAAFNAHFNEVFPGMMGCTEDTCVPQPPHYWICYGEDSGIPPAELYECGWYNYWSPRWNEALAVATVDAVQNVLDIYFPPPLSSAPSAVPSETPSSAPSFTASLSPSAVPSETPSSAPSSTASVSPSAVPSRMPSSAPSSTASVSPSAGPSKMPSFAPSSTASVSPSAVPSKMASSAPSSTPSVSLSAAPSVCVDTSPTRVCSKSGCPNEDCCATCSAPAPSCAGNKQQCQVNGDCCSDECTSKKKCKGDRRLGQTIDDIFSFQDPIFGGQSMKVKDKEKEREEEREKKEKEKEKEKAKLDNAKGHWKLNGAKNYDIELLIDSFGPQEFRRPFILQVREGVVNVLDRSSGTVVDPWIAAELPNTVEDIFDLIEGELKFDPKYLRVDYSSSIGHPRRVYLAPGKEKRERGRTIYYFRNFVRV